MRAPLFPNPTPVFHPPFLNCSCCVKKPASQTLSRRPTMRTSCLSTRRRTKRRRLCTRRAPPCSPRSSATRRAATAPACWRLRPSTITRRRRLPSLGKSKSPRVSLYYFDVGIFFLWRHGGAVLYSVFLKTPKKTTRGFDLLNLESLGHAIYCLGKMSAESKPHFLTRFVQDVSTYQYKVTTPPAHTNMPKLFCRTLWVHPITGRYWVASGRS